MATLPTGLLPWEHWTVPTENWHPTPLPNVVTVTTLALAALLSYLFWAQPLLWLAGLLSARLFALDVHFRVLPHLYTILLFILTFVAMPLVHIGIGVGLVLLIIGMPLILSKLFNWPANIGGGDIALLLALGAWCGPAVGLVLIGAFILQLALNFMVTWRPLPFGPALLLAFHTYLVITLA